MSTVPSKCSACKLGVPLDGDYVTCSKCAACYHFDKCSGVAAKTWRGKSALRKADYVCSGCRADNVTTDENESVTIKLIRAELKPIDVKISGVMSSIEYQSSKFDTILEQLKLYKEQIEGLKSEVKELKVENSDLKNRVDKLEQYTRRNNIIISNVPYHKDEDVTRIVQNVGSKIGCTISDTDVDVCHRLPSASGQNAGNIIVKFCRRVVKQEFIKKKRSNKLTVGNLEIASCRGSEQPIYINEHLTVTNAEIFKRARQLRNHGYKYVWTRDCKVLARKTEGSKIIYLHNLDSVEALFSS